MAAVAAAKAVAEASTKEAIDKSTAADNVIAQLQQQVQVQVKVHNEQVEQLQVVPACDTSFCYMEVMVLYHCIDLRLTAVA